MVHPINQVSLMAEPPPDLETIIVSTVAHVDQLTAEHNDPQTSEARKKAIHEECRRLYAMLQEVQRRFRQGHGHP